jgi:cysteine-rich repeat protein
VTVSEVIRGVLIARAATALDVCPAFDEDGDGVVSDDELQTAIRHALAGCPGPPTPTPTVTPTPTETPTPTVTPTPTETSTPPLSERECGNGVVEPGEQCDDGNPVDGDGCDEFCRIETAADPCVGVTPLAGTKLAAVRVASGMAQPLHATAPPGDLERLFIVERSGRIRILRDGALLPEPFLNLTDRVVTGGERGLLSLAFHPRYESNGEFFVDYTRLRGEETVSIVSRFRVSSDPDLADRDSEEILLEQVQPFIAHNGGQLAFDRLGYLFIAFGDGGRSASQQNTAQDPTTWLGKILRIDVDGGRPYAIPIDNPFVGIEGYRPEIWVMGLRNPWRFSIDQVSGDLVLGDVGEGRTEEVNVVPAGGGGLNFGWCCMEGDETFTRCFQRASVCPGDGEGLTSPTLQYDHADGCSVTGGFVYRGCALPELRGTYFYADYCRAWVRSMRLVDGAVTEERDWTDDLAPGGGVTIDLAVGFGQDGRGELYVCDFGGEVFKLVPAPAQEEQP